MTKDPIVIEAELEELRRRIEDLERKTVFPFGIPYVPAPIPTPFIPAPVYPYQQPWTITCGGVPGGTVGKVY